MTKLKLIRELNVLVIGCIGLGLLIKFMLLALKDSTQLGILWVLLLILPHWHSQLLDLINPFLFKQDRILSGNFAIVSENIVIKF